MKDLKLLIICSLLTLVLYSCKDNTTDPVVNPPQPEVLFQFDSISISSSDSGSVDSIMSISYLIADTNINNIRFQFNAQSNATVPNDAIFYGLSVGRPGQVSLLSIKENIYNNLDTTFDQTYNIAPPIFNGMTAIFSIGIERKTDHSYRYVRMKDIKITKMN